MPERNLEINGPPHLQELLGHPDVGRLFFDIAYSGLRTQAKAAKSDHIPLVPNRLRVTPYLLDQQVGYIMNSCVQLDRPGICQVREQAIEPTWTYMGNTEVLGLKDSDSGELLDPLTYEDQASIAIIGTFYALAISQVSGPPDL